MINTERSRNDAFSFYFIGDCRSSLGVDHKGGRLYDPPEHRAEAILFQRKKERNMKEVLLDTRGDISRTALWDFALTGEWGTASLFFKEDPCPMWFYRDSERTWKWISAGEEPGREAYLMILLHLEKNPRVTDYARRFLPRLKNDYADLRLIGRTFRLDNIFLFAETVAGLREVFLTSREESFNISFAKLLLETPSLAVHLKERGPFSPQRDKKAFSLSA